MQRNMEDNFEQYSAVPNEDVDRGSVARNSVEDSFNQYDNLDKSIESVDRLRQEERRKVALVLIDEYKTMAIT